MSGIIRSQLAFALALGGISLLLVSSRGAAEAPLMVLAQAGAHAPAAEAHAATAHPDVAEHAAETHAADAHAAGHDSGHGEYTLWSDLPFWSAIAFLGFVLAIRKLGLWDLLLNSMSQREQAETEAIVLAEADLSEARAMLRQSRGRMEALDESIRAALAEAERDVNYTRTEIQRQGEKESASFMTRVEHEVSLARDHSLHEIFSTLADKVATLTEQRLSQRLGSEDQQRLIDSTLDQLAIHS